MFSRKYEELRNGFAFLGCVEVSEAGRNKVTVSGRCVLSGGGLGTSLRLVPLVRNTVVLLWLWPYFHPGVLAQSKEAEKLTVMFSGGALIKICALKRSLRRV